MFWSPSPGYKIEEHHLRPALVFYLPECSSGFPFQLWSFILALRILKCLFFVCLLTVLQGLRPPSCLPDGCLGDEIVCLFILLPPCLGCPEPHNGEGSLWAVVKNGQKNLSEEYNGKMQEWEMVRVHTEYLSIPTKPDV